MRLAAAKELQNGADEDLLPAIAAAIAKETDPEIKGMLQMTQASIQLSSPTRRHGSPHCARWPRATMPAPRPCFSACSSRRAGNTSSPTPTCALRPRKSLHSVQSRLSTGELVGRVFSGIILGSILLLAALGLAITYGLMGVINMAHGELIMIGAYATYLVQNLFRAQRAGRCSMLI